MLLDGHVVVGTRSLAEIGHTVLDLTAHGHGQPASLEDLGSGTALGRRAVEAGLPRDGARIVELVHEGHPAATRIWDELVSVIIAGVRNLAFLFSPSVVVLGGGVGRNGDLLIAPISAALQRHGPPTCRPPSGSSWPSSATTRPWSAPPPGTTPGGDPAMVDDTEHPDQRITLVRHAQTEWSLSGQHNGTTDLPLTDQERSLTYQLRSRLADNRFDRVLTSPLRRAAETCRIAGFADTAEVHHDLVEWDYGTYEGRTTADIRTDDPGWDLWRDGAPGGETPAAMSARIDRVVDDLLDTCARGADVLVFAHGHSLTALTIRWLGLPITHGRHLRLGTGAVSLLGWKREVRILEVWNDRSHIHQQQQRTR